MCSSEKGDDDDDDGDSVDLGLKVINCMWEAAQGIFVWSLSLSKEVPSCASQLYININYLKHRYRYMIISISHYSSQAYVEIKLDLHHLKQIYIIYAADNIKLKAFLKKKKGWTLRLLIQCQTPRSKQLQLVFFTTKIIICKSWFSKAATFDTGEVSQWVAGRLV